MLIGEVVRTCANDRVAHAAIASIGRRFLADVTERATAYDMSVGEFAKLSVERFLRHGDEAELRSVTSVMIGAQEPVLAGLHRVLCIMLASTGSSDRHPADRKPCLAAQLCALEADRRDIRI